MPRLTSLPSWIFFASLGVGALCAGPTLAQSDLTTEDWREDLAYLVREMERRHASVFHTVDRTTFEAAAADLDARIPTLADHEVIVEMARIAALIGDAHTYVAIPRGGPLAFRRYPVRFERLKDGVFITRTDSAHADAIGARVVGIGGMPIEEVWNRIEPVINRDNAMTIRYLLPFRIAIPEVLHAVGVIADPGRAEFVIEQDGRQDTLRLDPVPSPVSFVPAAGLGNESVESLFWKDPDTNYWFESVPKHRAVYFQFNSVRSDPADPFPVFLERLDSALAAPNADRLIIDLRRNTGGGWEMTIPLVRMLIRQGFDEPGRLIVLTGPATISAATVFAVELDRWLHPIFVGLPTGSRPNQFGEIVFFELPNSGLRAGYAAALFQTAGYATADPWVVPDVAIDMAAGDYFARRDPVLRVALTYEIEEPLEETLDRAYAEGGVTEVLAAEARYRSDPRQSYLDTERALRQLGDRLVEDGRLDDALLIHCRNVELHPDRVRARYGLAETFAALGRADDARRSFEEALERVKDDPSLYPALAIVIETAIREELKAIHSPD